MQPTTIRRAITSAVQTRKIVIVGAGFVGSYIAKALVANSRNRIVLASRHPEKLHSSLKHLGSQLLPPTPLDVTKPSTLLAAFQGADAVISLVGILNGTEKEFVELQQKGGENVAAAAKEAGVKRVVMVSALGVDESAPTPYARTKALAEKAFMAANPSTTIIRPSLVFGPGDSFFGRFAVLAQYLPFLPLFGGGKSLFQPIYVGDLARAVEICSRDDAEVAERVGGKIVEGGGPEVFTYKQLMRITLDHARLHRLLLPLPFWFGTIQAFFLNLLPTSIFTVTPDQITQLKSNNIQSPPSPTRLTVADLLARYPPPGISAGLHEQGDLENPEKVLKTVGEVLPLYLPLGRAEEARENGKRKHGRGSDSGIEEVRRLTQMAESAKNAKAK